MHSLLFKNTLIIATAVTIGAAALTYGAQGGNDSKDIAESITITTDKCQLSAHIAFIRAHGGDYQLAQGYEYPAIKITAEQAVMAKLHEQKGVTTQYPSSDCALPDIRYHTPNVNARLAPYVPADVDYVSYSPYADKAVYCYHPESRQTGGRSACYFIHLYTTGGELRLQTDDISAMQDVNLWAATQGYDRNALKAHYVHSEITGWHREPSPPYGFDLHTIYDDKRWLAWGRY